MLMVSAVDDDHVGSLFACSNRKSKGLEANSERDVSRVCR